MSWDTGLQNIGNFFAWIDKVKSRLGEKQADIQTAMNPIDLKALYGLLVYVVEGRVVDWSIL